MAKADPGLRCNRWRDHEEVEHAHFPLPDEGEPVLTTTASAPVERRPPRNSVSTSGQGAEEQPELGAEGLRDLPYERVIGALCDRARRLRTPIATWGPPPITRSVILAEQAAKQQRVQQRAAGKAVRTAPCGPVTECYYARHPPLDSQHLPHPIQWHSKPDQDAAYTGHGFDDFVPLNGPTLHDQGLLAHPLPARASALQKGYGRESHASHTRAFRLGSVAGTHPATSRRTRLRHL